MRRLRALVLVTALGGASGVVADLLLDPLLASWRVLSAPSTAATSASGGLATVVVGCCAALLLVSWLWLLAAVGACTWEALCAGSDPLPGATTSLLRPRLVRALVATCLGATALASPSAQALEATGAEVPPDRVLSTSAGPAVTGRHVLEGLPVPDRATGGIAGRPPGGAAGSARHREPGSPAATSTRSGGAPAPAAGRRSLEVRAGDSLWSLTAGLLPADAPAATVAQGWRLLYAANRAVVGRDPDLLHPGQSLRIDGPLLELVRSAGTGRDAGQVETRP